MDKDTRRLPALFTDPINMNDNKKDSNHDSPAANNTNNVNNRVLIGASPETASDSSSKPVKPQRRRNKPSLSCETCTVSP